jgi:hypothetical protein
MKLLKQIDALFRTGTAAGLTDGELLERFVQRREETAEAAFAAVVDRHGAMVLRICRQVLRNQHDAEEAAQATFLVLARRAGSIRRRDSVASWLHGVALRVAAKAPPHDGEATNAEGERSWRPVMWWKRMRVRSKTASTGFCSIRSWADCRNPLGRPSSSATWKARRRNKPPRSFDARWEPSRAVWRGDGPS